MHGQDCSRSSFSPCKFNNFILQSVILVSLLIPPSSSIKSQHQTLLSWNHYIGAQETHSWFTVATLLVITKSRATMPFSSSQKNPWGGARQLLLSLQIKVVDASLNAAVPLSSECYSLKQTLKIKTYCYRVGDLDTPRGNTLSQDWGTLARPVVKTKWLQTFGHTSPTCELTDSLHEYEILFLSVGMLLV